MQSFKCCSFLIDFLEGGKYGGRKELISVDYFCGNLFEFSKVRQFGLLCGSVSQVSTSGTLIWSCYSFIVGT